MAAELDPCPAASTSAIPTLSPATSSSSTPNPPKSARGRPTDDPDTRWSKTLSYILRHGAQKESLVLRPDGFVRVEDLLKRPKLKGCDMDTLDRIVRDNAKQRFTMRGEPTGEGGQEELWIRANQGHSVKVEALELKPVEKAEDVPLMVHGTYYRLWRVIGTSVPTLSIGGRRLTCPSLLLREGGSKGHVSESHSLCDRFAWRGWRQEWSVDLLRQSDWTLTYTPRAGMRANCDLFIYLNVPLLLAARAHDSQSGTDSISVYTSTNHVVLTAGLDGVIPPKYFSKVVRKSGEVLVPPSAS
ncbi:SPOSA6832_01850, partial [Sporobolomyces salmonicolor]